MIFDSIKNIEFYRLPHKNFKLALDFILNQNILFLADGKYPIAGDKVYLSIFSYSTKKYENSLWEAHRKYADIHMILEGSELIALADKQDLITIKKYSKKNDVLLLKGNPKIITQIPLMPSTFLLLLPGEIHMPGLNILDKAIKQNVRKAVIKVLF